MSDQSVQGERMLSFIRTKFPTYHPIMAIAEMANNEETDDHLKYECHKTILKHVSPELKSIEVKAEVTSHRRVIVSLFDGEEPTMLAAATIEQSPQVTTSIGDPLWAQLEHILAEEVAA